MPNLAENVSFFYGDGKKIPRQNNSLISKIGSEWYITIRNPFLDRSIEAILSVDGVDVISGKASSDADAGYVVRPLHSIQIRGWREDKDTVAAFKFVDVSLSYASQRGIPGHVGEIDLRVFEESIPKKKDPPDWKKYSPQRWIPGLPDPLRTYPMAGSGPGDYLDLDRSITCSVGTGFGRAIPNPMSTTMFNRSLSCARFHWRYDTREALIRDGWWRETTFCPPPAIRV